MCGRAAQTFHAVQAAAQSLGLMSVPAGLSSVAAPPVSPVVTTTTTASLLSAPSLARSIAADGSYEKQDNYNMSPGMEAWVFVKDDNGRTTIPTKVWGLVPRGGSNAQPLEAGMNLHFSNLMFNARSDTFYEKATFSRLANQGRSCLIAVDGFFEWKDDMGPGKKQKKQPYYVYRQAKDRMHRPYLLMPGVWTSVPTGRSEDPILETFTIVTTSVCPPLKWLHTRMPVCIWDESFALAWLNQPSNKLLRQMEDGAMNTPEGLLGWHRVSKDMTSMKFRSADAIKAVAGPKTLQSFFGAKASPKTLVNPTPNAEAMLSPLDKKSVQAPSDASIEPNASAGTKRAMPSRKATTPAVSQTSKRIKSSPASSKKGPIDSFFSPKKALSRSP